MSVVITLRLVLPCPSCGLTGPQRVALRHGGDRGSAPAPGWHAGTVHACEPCWRSRARALGRARERLRALGLVGESPASGVTWEGVPLGHRESQDDPLTDATVSDLLREGFAERDGVEVTLRVVGREIHVESPAEACPTA